MTITDLARILRNAHADGEGDMTKALNIHLYGIRYAHDLRGVRLAEVVKLAGIPPSYNTEIAKGIKLSAYVRLTVAAIHMIEKADRP